MKTRLVLISLLIACNPPPPAKSRPAVEETEPEPALPTTAPKAQWNGTKLSIDGQPWSLDLNYGVDGKITLTTLGAGASWPEATKAIIAGNEQTLTNYGTATFDEMFAVYGALPIANPPTDQIASTKIAFKPTASLKLVLSNGVEIVTTLPAADVSAGLVRRLAIVALEKGLVFDGDKEHSGPHTTLALMPGGSERVIGAGKTLADADWIAAVSEDIKPGGGKLCAFTGAKLPLEVATYTVKIVERRTRKTIDEKSFAPTNIGCPMFALNDRAILGPDPKLIDEWIQSIGAARGG